MPDVTDNSRSLDAVVTVGPKGRGMVRLPFSPDQVWGTKPHHHVAGTIGSHRVRAVVEAIRDGHAIVLGPAWRRDCGIGATCVTRTLQMLRSHQSGGGPPTRVLRRSRSSVSRQMPLSCPMRSRVPMIRNPTA